MKRRLEDAIYCFGQSVSIVLCICVALVGYALFTKILCVAYKLLGLILNPVKVITLLWVITAILCIVCFIVRRCRINK